MCQQTFTFVGHNEYTSKQISKYINTRIHLSYACTFIAVNHTFRQIVLEMEAK